MRGKLACELVDGGAAGLIPAHAGKTRPARRRTSLRGAHPRSRGEHQDEGSVTGLEGGSSPLMRGKLLQDDRFLPVDGLIPAHAGKTEPGCSRTSPSTAHPHSCGENVVCFCAPSAVQGSSPLMRGKRGHGSHGQVEHGLIPAHTGKTRACRAEPTSTRAHPRSRGENPPPLEVPKYAMGSSPLMRGKSGRVHGVTERLGLIPTHAGKTWSATERSPSRTAHPRSRGENRESTTQKVPRAGSSPLTRGELACDTQGVDVVGLIPTHAGKTLQSVGGFYSWAAHPCSRGENHWQEWALAQIPGPSPLTRGKRLRTRSRGRAGRLIPAHAGKTIAHLSSGPCARAHPHSCGENVKTVLTMFQTVGSSPLMRGKRQRWFPCRRRSRLIPAHAGKTSEYTPCPG